MFDMCSSYCENFIYISLSIAIWYLWKLTNNQNAISAQKVNSLNITQTNRGVEFIIFLREKHISWTIFGLNHRLNDKKVEKSSSCLTRVKNSL